MWGTLLADIVIQMLGFDYARIVQEIYAFVQVRYILSNGLVSVCMGLYVAFVADSANVVTLHGVL
jgi:hypothetical protein